LEHRDELLTIAEIAIGIAGFSGVMAAFLQRGGLHGLDRVRFVNLFVLAFTTLTLAFVPIVVAEVSDAIWFYSSSVMIAVWFINIGFGIFYVLPQVRKNEGPSDILPGLLVWIPSFLNLGVQCLNLTGWLWEPGFLAYIFGLFVYLYVSCLCFVFVVLYRPSLPDAAQ
jgi:hypothetical protein